MKMSSQPSRWSRLMTAVAAFREAYVTSSNPQGTTGVDEFASYPGRSVRYAMLWALFENTIYRDIHLWAQRYRTEYGLYKWTRPIYNPAQRLVDFYVAHLMGGSLDPAAGDGSQTSSALPIITSSETLRLAISTLWRHSNWATQKEIWSLQGTALGDSFLQVIDDTKRKKVYIQVVHPSWVQDLEKDHFGNVKGYTLSYHRQDPLDPAVQVAYREEATRDGDNVLYRTYRNDTLYPWNEVEAEWTEPYGFIPLVATQHRSVGASWGWAELFPSLPKVREVDDLASKLSDYIRKTVDAPWLLAGVPSPGKKSGDVSVQGREATTSAPQPGREEVPIIYGPLGATAVPLVADLDIPGTYTYIQGLLEELERDYPELRVDVLVTGGGDASGRAIRMARQRASVKVLQRRTAYDESLVKAHQMAIGIGGWRGYEGFTGFDLESYDKGRLDHVIGQRPVFAVDELDRLEEELALWTAAKASVDSGYSLPLFLKRNGFSDQDLAAMEKDPVLMAKRKALENGTSAVDTLNSIIGNGGLTGAALPGGLLSGADTAMTGDMGTDNSSTPEGGLEGIHA